jgi:hypothetical protein
MKGIADGRSGAATVDAGAKDKKRVGRSRDRVRVLDRRRHCLPTEVNLCFKIPAFFSRTRDLSHL